MSGISLSIGGYRRNPFASPFAWVLARGLAGEQIATNAAASAVVMLLVWVALPRQHAA